MCAGVVNYTVGRFNLGEFLPVQRALQVNKRPQSQTSHGGLTDTMTAMMPLSSGNVILTYHIWAVLESALLPERTICAYRSNFTPLKPMLHSRNVKLNSKLSASFRPSNNRRRSGLN